MPLDVEHAQVTMDTVAGAQATGAASPAAPLTAHDRDLLKERLRPIVLEILDEELDKHRRSQGH
jgi:hypothetical protein